jgi:hypothetical protein
MANALDTTEVEIAEARHEDVALDSVTLARLLTEVRNKDVSAPGGYDRQHNRHNR